MGSVSAPPARRGPTAESAALNGPASQAMPPPFLTKLFDLVSDPATNELICWNDDGTLFTVHKPTEFARDVLPQYFKHSNFSSFVRQLNQYGFHKRDPDRWTFGHSSFKRGEPHALADISRRRPTRVPIVMQDPSAVSAPASQGVAGSPAVELGNFGGTTVEVLKRDRDMLLKALVHTRMEETKLKEKCDTHERRINALESNLKNIQTFIVGYFNQVVNNFNGNMRSKRRRIMPGELDETGDQMIEDTNKALQLIRNNVDDKEHSGEPTFPGTGLDAEAMRRAIMSRFNPSNVGDDATNTVTLTPTLPTFPQASIEEVRNDSDSLGVPLSAEAGAVVSAAAAEHLGELRGRPSDAATISQEERDILDAAGLSTPKLDQVAGGASALVRRPSAKPDEFSLNMFDDLEAEPFPALQELPPGTDIDLLSRQLEEFERAV